jgi:Icc protein
MSFTLTQISDSHLLADPAGTVLECPVRDGLDSVVARAALDAPDAVLVTGDLSQDATAASYTAVREALRPLGAPCYATPGNHDDAEVMRAALADEPFRPVRSFAAGDWRVLLLDSAVPGEVHGRLSKRALAQMKRSLAAYPQTPTLVALHHPPRPPGAAWLDPLGLHDPGPFLDLVEAHSQVRLVLFGHIHQEMETRHAQARLLGCPATCFQFEPHAETFALDPRRPAGYRRVELSPDGSFTTRVERVECTYTLDMDAPGY